MTIKFFSEVFFKGYTLLFRQHSASINSQLSLRGDMLFERNNWKLWGKSKNSWCVWKRSSLLVFPFPTPNKKQVWVWDVIPNLVYTTFPPRKFVRIVWIMVLVNLCFTYYYIDGPYTFNFILFLSKKTDNFPCLLSYFVQTFN